MESVTVSHQDFNSKQGERWPITKPRDSNVLRGEGSFASETQSGSDYTPKKGERYDIVKLETSDIWRVCMKFQSFSASILNLLSQAFNLTLDASNLPILFVSNDQP